MHFEIDPSKWSQDGEPILSNYDQETLLDHAQQVETIARLDNFGLWMLSVEDAAFRIAFDMLDSGEIDCPALEDFDGPMDAPEVKTALSDLIATFEERITKAIELGRLKTQQVIRDFDENIVRSKTYIDHFQLEQWVIERGYYLGETFTDWYDSETALAERVADELIWLRNVKRKRKGAGLTVGYTNNPNLMQDWESADLIDAYKSIMLENEHLREKLAKSEAKALVSNDEAPSPKTRQTLLLVIASLLDLLKAPTTHARPHGMNQTAIKETILEQFKVRGLGDRNLQDIFASANKAKTRAD